jgi:hypothetical protein
MPSVTLRSGTGDFRIAFFFSRRPRWATPHRSRWIELRGFQHATVAVDFSRVALRSDCFCGTSIHTGRALRRASHFAIHPVLFIFIIPDMSRFVLVL